MAGFPTFEMVKIQNYSCQQPFRMKLWVKFLSTDRERLSITGTVTVRSGRLG